MRRVVHAWGLLLLLAACRQMPQVTPADASYLLLASDIEQFPMEQYRHMMTAGSMPYLFLKGYSEGSGSTSWYGTILVARDGTEVRYLCMVNVLPAAGQAGDLFGRLTPEPSPTSFGTEEKIDPRVYGADAVYLYRDDAYFHLIVRTSRIVYAVVVEGAHVEERQVRNVLKRKIAYLQEHPDAPK